MKTLIPAFAAITLAASTSAFAQVTPPVTSQSPPEVIQNQPTTPPADPGMLGKNDSTSNANESAQKNESAQNKSDGMHDKAARSAGSSGPMLTDAQAQAWINKPVYSSDNRNLGEVAAIKRDTAGNVTEIHADIGGFLGIGETRVRVLPDQFKLGDERIVLNVDGDASKQLPKIDK